MDSLFLVLIDGPMGSGKTTTSKLLNERLPDTARIALPDIKRLIPNYRENERTLSVIREVMKAMVDKYLELGVSVILEQITKVEGLDALALIAEKHGAKFYPYRLSAPKDVRLARVHERTKGMMGVHELPPEKIEELAAYFGPNDTFYEQNPLTEAERIQTSSMTPDQVTDAIIKKLVS